MKSVKELGFLQVGMELVDRKGNKGTITKLSGDDFLLVEVDNSPNPTIWDWDRVHPGLMVVDGTY
ncbi:hypothetical protein [Oceanobacillus sp. Castelsardo]|uniref:hypothetical protein n=1 Tax=Oceanobacillus sp. Castelsardo TaxID=1851204 RepID=UPI00083975AB|nr:hypothetical protein [Oceanobacillus sp. Castelsardo]